MKLEGLRKLDYPELTRLYEKTSLELVTLHKDYLKLRLETNTDLALLLEAINALGEKPEFKEAHDFLMEQIPTTECP